MPFTTPVRALSLITVCFALLCVLAMVISSVGRLFGSVYCLGVAGCGTAWFVGAWREATASRMASSLAGAGIRLERVESAFACSTATTGALASAGGKTGLLVALASAFCGGAGGVTTATAESVAGCGT